ncbi:MAG: hypothetical protein KF752_10295 [Pirellulaceae bacterium]|nr:hypothetical protein [Pirellulaceae bacterium]
MKDTQRSPTIAESPFQERQPVRLSFSMLMLLLLMVVASGVAMLLGLAMRVPAFSNDLRAFWGLTEVTTDAESSRKAQIVFVMFLYIAPLGLGLAVYALHHLLNWLSRFRTSQPDGDEYRMES